MHCHCDMQLSKNIQAIYSIYKRMPARWQLHISKRACPEHLNLCMRAILAKAIRYSNFQIEIQRFDFTAKMTFYKKVSLKPSFISNGNVLTESISRVYRIFDRAWLFGMESIFIDHLINDETRSEAEKKGEIWRL